MSFRSSTSSRWSDSSSSLHMAPTHTYDSRTAGAQGLRRLVQVGLQGAWLKPVFLAQRINAVQHRVRRLGPLHRHCIQDTRER